MPFGATVRNLAGTARMLTARVGQSLYDRPGNSIAGLDPGAWPAAGQPVAPLGPPGSKPLQIPFWFGQNLTFTPRPDAVYTAAELKQLSMYPLARLAIDNAKDILCQVPWSIELRKMPGETLGEVKMRRKTKTKGDAGLLKFSRFFERPSAEHDWEQWARPIIEDMLTIDAATTFIERNKKDEIVGMRPFPGEFITRYVDDSGYTPQPPSPAYSQNWEGSPRINLTTDQIVYRPRNYVHRPAMISSYLYGCSPNETLAEVTKIGAARLNYIFAYYAEGATGNLIQVVPPRIGPDKISEAQQSYNADMSGNFGNRRRLRLLQGWREDGKDQIIETKEPILTDEFDQWLIKVTCYAFGVSAQRLMKMMNRGSAQQSQSAATEEGIKPFMDWLRRLVNYILQVKLNAPDYEMVFQDVVELDYLKKATADSKLVSQGLKTRQSVLESNGDAPPDNPGPYYSELTYSSPTGVIPIGSVVSSGGGDGSAQTVTQAPPAPKGTGKVNGHAADYGLSDGGHYGLAGGGHRLVMRGE